jgi:hypothetical protein
MRVASSRRVTDSPSTRTMDSVMRCAARSPRRISLRMVRVLTPNTSAACFTVRSVLKPGAGAAGRSGKVSSPFLFRSRATPCRSSTRGRGGSPPASSR